MWNNSLLHEEVEKAEKLYEAFGADILADENIAGILIVYRDLIIESDDLMQRRGVSAACTECAAGTGSCCFEGIESGYDSVLLLINLLFGRRFSRKAQIPGRCHFVGENGCTLLARYAFCLNYLCPILKMMLGESTRDEILRKIGEQLTMGWEVEQALRRWLSDRAARC